MKLFWIVTFILAACGGGSLDIPSNEVIDDDSIIEVPVTGQPAPFASESNLSEPAPVEKKIRKSGSISFQSQNLDKDYAQIKSLMPRYKAYIENENQSNDQYRRNYQLSIRVEGAYFDSLLNAISSLAWRVEFKTANIDDVTERYYDLKTRIENKKALEQRYRELLAKANDIKDVLEIEKNINEVRTDIEMMQGQFNYLSSQIQYSSLDVQFYEELPYALNPTQKKGFGNRIANALANGWNGLLTILVGLVTLWPFYLVGIGIFLLISYLRKKGKKNV
jgi:hypothetical protein